VEPGHAQPVQLAFDGIGQGGRCRRDPWGECGGAAEAGKVERDHVVVVAEGRVDRSPAAPGFSDPVQQDQWLARSVRCWASWLVVGAARRDAMSVSSSWGAASEHRHLSESRGWLHYSGRCLWVAGSLEGRDTPGPA
jgi:hypothetical protein